MSISPFNAHPVSPETESRRARLVLAIAIIGIAATLLAYAVSPGVRHAVGHAAHSVKRAVSRALDHDTTESKKKTTPTRKTTTRSTTNGATLTTTGSPATQKSP
jgi:type II secretory pathway pseudopilin PulG